MHTVPRYPIRINAMAIGPPSTLICTSSHVQERLPSDVGHGQGPTGTPGSTVPAGNRGGPMPVGGRDSQPGLQCLAVRLPFRLLPPSGLGRGRPLPAAHRPALGALLRGGAVGPSRPLQRSRRGRRRPRGLGRGRPAHQHVPGEQPQAARGGAPVLSLAAGGALPEVRSGADVEAPVRGIAHLQAPQKARQRCHGGAHPPQSILH
mmetsp:Transcript_32878/g.87451  ORF Transcript_32878/g.87451 Transcript_32878/m.87451 type:complete len:205 (-) Transcript_32878:752-1366(-)